MMSSTFINKAERQGGAVFWDSRQRFCQVRAGTAMPKSYSDGAVSLGFA